MITRAVAASGIAWAAPTILSADPQASAACTCYAYKIGNVALTTTMDCTAYTSASSTSGNNCANMNAAWVAALAANCTTYGSLCPSPQSDPGTFSGVTVDWTGGDQSAVVTFPAGAVPVFLGARLGGPAGVGGCVWLSCGGFASNCTTLSADPGTGACPTPGCTCLCWDASSRQFRVSKAGFTGGTGISHLVFAWKSCGS